MEKTWQQKLAIKIENKKGFYKELHKSYSRTLRIYDTVKNVNMFQFVSLSNLQHIFEFSICILVSLSMQI